MVTTNDNATALYNATGTIDANGAITGGAWVEFATLVDIDPNKVSIGSVSKLKLKSKAKETQASKTPDYGEVTLTLEYTAALVTLINGWIDNALTLGIKTTVEDFTGTGAVPSETVYPAHVTGWEPISGTIQRDGENRTVSKLTLKVCAKPVFTAGHGAA
jgi:hypothetical protein